MQALTKFASIELLSCVMSWSVISVVQCVKLSVSSRLSYGEHHKILYRFVNLAVLFCHLVIAMGYTALWQITAIFLAKQKKKKFGFCGLGCGYLGNEYDLSPDRTM